MSTQNQQSASEANSFESLTDFEAFRDALDELLRKYFRLGKELDAKKIPLLGKGKLKSQLKEIDQQLRTLLIQAEDKLSGEDAAKFKALEERRVDWLEGVHTINLQRTRTRKKLASTLGNTAGTLAESSRNVVAETKPFIPSLVSDSLFIISRSVTDGVLAVMKGVFGSRNKEPPLARAGT